MACLVASGVATSCTDLLEIDQHGVQNYDTYYQTDEQIEAAVTECYQQALNMGLGSFTNKALLDGDFWCGGGQRGDNGGFEQMNEYRFSADLGSILSWFQGYYTAINRCNIVLDKCSENGSSVAKRACAEARVIRGLMYFELASMWGTVPMVDHVIEASEAGIGNTDMATLWKFIEDDLNAAISSGVLFEKSGVDDTSADKWRVSKQFAQALLGKAYLWAGNKVDAAKCFDDVILSKKYALYGEEGRPATEEYQNVIQNRAKFNCESLFESSQGNDPNNWGFTTAGCMLRWRSGNFTNTWMVVNSMDMNAVGPAIDTNYWSYFSGQDYGFYNPTGALVAAFDANGDTYRKEQTIKSVDWVCQNLGFVLSGNLYGVEDYLMWKWRAGVDTQNWGGYGAMSYTNNYRWMRLAEVYLLAAEANLESDPTKAANYLNKVRRRAKLADKGNITLADIQLEKQCELCGEGVRFQDIQRWGLGGQLLSKMGEKIPTRSAAGIAWDTKANNDPSKYGYKTGKHELLPMPFKEIQMNKNLKQNPGWD